MEAACAALSLSWPKNFQLSRPGSRKNRASTHPQSACGSLTTDHCLLSSQLINSQLLCSIAPRLSGNKLSLEFGIPASKIRYRSPLLHTVVGEACLKRLDSRLAFR